MSQYQNIRNDLKPVDYINSLYSFTNDYKELDLLKAKLYSLKPLILHGVKIFEEPFPTQTELQKAYIGDIYPFITELRNYYENYLKKEATSKKRRVSETKTTVINEEEFYKLQGEIQDYKNKIQRLNEEIIRLKKEKDVLQKENTELFITKQELKTSKEKLKECKEKLDEMKEKEKDLDKQIEDLKKEKVRIKEGLAENKREKERLKEKRKELEETLKKAKLEYTRNIQKALGKIAEKREAEEEGRESQIDEEIQKIVEFLENLILAMEGPEEEMEVSEIKALLNEKERQIEQMKKSYQDLEDKYNKIKTKTEKFEEELESNPTRKFYEKNKESLIYTKPETSLSTFDETKYKLKTRNKNFDPTKIEPKGLEKLDEFVGFYLNSNYRVRGETLKVIDSAVTERNFPYAQAQITAELSYKICKEKISLEALIELLEGYPTIQRKGSNEKRDLIIDIIFIEKISKREGVGDTLLAALIVTNYARFPRNMKTYEESSGNNPIFNVQVQTYRDEGELTESFTYGTRQDASKTGFSYLIASRPTDRTARGSPIKFSGPKLKYDKNVVTNIWGLDMSEIVVLCGTNEIIYETDTKKETKKTQFRLKSLLLIAAEKYLVQKYKPNYIKTFITGGFDSRYKDSESYMADKIYNEFNLFSHYGTYQKAILSDLGKSFVDDPESPPKKRPYKPYYYFGLWFFNNLPVTPVAIKKIDFQDSSIKENEGVKEKLEFISTPVKSTS